MIDLREYDQKSILTSREDDAFSDGFGRLRVSQVDTQGEIKQLYDNLPLSLSQVTNGTATITHNLGDANTTITTSSNGDYGIAQTKRRFNYQTGKSLERYSTYYDMDSETGIVKMFGYFSSSTSAPYNTNYDGFWLEASGGTHYWVTSKTGTETSRVARADWYDSLDGGGPSGLDFSDLDGNIIENCDFEWLGLGRLRIFIIHGGIKYRVHEVDFVNGSKRRTVGGWITIDANFKGVYMASPNQPLRWEVRQTAQGVSSSTTFVCSSVGSEGAINRVGKEGGIDDNGTHLNANSTSNWYYAIGMRLKSTHLDSVVDLIDTSLLSVTNDNFLYRIYFNPTYNGSVTYTDIANYSVQYGLGTLSNTISAGTILAAGTGAQRVSEKARISNSIKLGADIDGTRDEIVIAVKPLSASMDIYRTINWIE